MAWTRFSQAAGGRARPVALLGLAQTLSWGSSFYLPAVLAHPMASDLGLPPPTVYLAFSGALVVSAAVGPAAGRAIDRLGGRPVLMACNGIFALGLVLLAMAQGPWGLFAAWALLGVAMGAGLYEAAFATLVKLYGQAARNPITGITLIAGFASTVGWPLSAWLLGQHGWRGACLGWAALHLLVGLPLNALLPRADPAAVPPPSPAGAAAPAPAGATTAAPPVQPAAATPQRALVALLSLFFAVSMFIGTAWATHLPQLLQSVGATLAVAIGVGALVGPAQVAGRVLEFSFLRRVHPLLSARLSSLAHPLGIVALLLLGAPAAALFAVLHGAGNGILTIAKGTLPLVLFGAQGYGARQGWLMMPARVAQASAPFVFGLALDRWGRGALWLSGALGLVAFAALMAIRLRHDPATDAQPPPR
ncbi:MFS transporter [Pseudaquabacterium pictum]|uniref:MFS transporter n=1 Tax=Pseudaquabacterium pictum TaxID=2315236 RepID=A0A480AVM2_9BURK|nr:MFS transporter [Rubrivivax pictus]GCL64232.1 MFS transporter [Rubrivivax pictus]